MTAYVLTDCRAYLAGLDITGYANELSLKQEADDHDVTTFGSGGWRSRIAGLKNIEASMKGFWESPLDTSGFTNLGVADQVATFSATGVEAGPAWFFQAANFNWERFGSVGDVDPFMLDLQSSNTVGMVAGQLAKAKGLVNATGVLGTALTDLSTNDQVSASQYLYASFHIFTAGTTITVVLESDDSAGFPSATTRATIGPLTTAGGTWATRVAGPITDTHYRFRISAITGTFVVAGAIGIA